MQSEDKPDTVPDHCKAGLEAMNANKPLAHVEPKQILERYLAGENIKTIAASFGIGHAAMYMWLWRNCPAEWVEARSCRAERQYDEAVDTMAEQAFNPDGSKVVLDGVALGRARETAKMRFGELAALRKVFSAAPTVQVNILPPERVEGRIAELERELGVLTITQLPDSEG